jgi:hypothetical protein
VDRGERYHPLLEAVLVEEMVARRDHVVSVFGQNHAHADDALLRLTLLSIDMYRPLVVILVGQELWWARGRIGKRREKHEDNMSAGRKRARVCLPVEEGTSVDQGGPG